MNNLWVKPNFGAKLPKETIDGFPYVDTKVKQLIDPKPKERKYVNTKVEQICWYKSKEYVDTKVTQWKVSFKVNFKIKHSKDEFNMYVDWLKVKHVVVCPSCDMFYPLQRVASEWKEMGPYVSIRKNNIAHGTFVCFL